MSGFRGRCVLEAICPEVLKSLSETELNAQIHKDFLTNLAKMGQCDALIFQQSRELDSESGFFALEKAAYCNAYISALTNVSGEEQTVSFGCCDLAAFT